MTRKAVWLPALTAAAVVLSGCGGGDDSGGGEEGAITIGVIAARSGGAAFYSEAALAGIELAVDEINEAGGIDGSELRLSVKDDQNNPSLTPTLTRELADEEVSAIVLVSGSASTLQAKPVLQQVRIPAVVPTNLNPTISEGPGNDYVFQTANTTPQIVGALIDAMSQYESIGIFTDASPTGTQLANTYRDAFTEGGIEVVALEAVDVGAQDASAQIGRLQDSGAEAIFISGQAAAEQSLFLRQAVEQGLDVPFYQDTTAGLPAYWELVGEAGLAQLTFVDQLDPENELTNELRATYEEAHPGEYMIGPVPQGYDAIQLIAESLRGTDSTEAADVAEALGKADVDAHWGQAGYRISCGGEHLCATLEGLVLRGFDGAAAGPVTERPTT